MKPLPHPHGNVVRAFSPGPVVEAVSLIAPALRRSAPTVLAVVLLGVLAALAETASVGMVLLLLSLTFRGAAAGEVRAGADAAAEGPLDAAAQTLVGWLGGQAGLAAAVLVGLIVLRLALVAAHGIVTSRFAARVSHQTRVALFAACIALPLLDLRDRSWGDLHTLVERHGDAVADAIDAFCNLVQALTVAAIMGALLLAVAPLLALVALATLMLLGAVCRRAERAVERSADAIAQAEREMSEQLIRSLQAMRTYRAYGLDGDLVARFAAASARTAAGQARADGVAVAAEPASHISALLAVLAMTVVASLTGTGVATVLLAVGLLYRLQPYVAGVQAERIGLAEQVPSLRKVQAMEGDAVRGAPAAGQAGDPHALPDAPLPIRFEGVWFTYPGAPAAALDGVTLDIPPLGWTLIEGRSGAGKSTLVNLLLRLIEPDDGQIVAGGIPLADLAGTGWRQRAAVCGQDIGLVRGTIRENLLLGNPQADAAALARAVAVAGLGPLLAGLPRGLDTRVGEQGATLSGGQQQRVAIARAVLRRPRLLILDEATSALDRPSQAAVLEAIREEMEGRGAVVLIGHHLDAMPPLAARYNLGDGQPACAVGALR